MRQFADALADSGLREAGYFYVNIDVGWQGYRGGRADTRSNAKCPDIKGLGNYLYELGLKFGIYSSPSPRNCLNRVGSHRGSTSRRR